MKSTRDILTKIVFLFSLYTFSLPAVGQNSPQEGTLFIVGGGKIPVEELVAAANLGPDDYIVFLPMSRANYNENVQGLLKDHCNNKIVTMDFDKADTYNKIRVDSVAHAKLIFISGGSQRRFMEIVRNTPLYTAIHQAFNRGATIAGTSAGAAVMSRVMITGQHVKHKAYKGFKSILYNNVRTIEGLGLLPSHVIIDQHFIKRSRFNRLLSALADHPGYQCVGIDEGTAIICRGNQAKVVGESQVMVLSNPRGLSMAPGNLVTVKDINLSLLTAGASFKLR